MKTDNELYEERYEKWKDNNPKTCLCKQCFNIYEYRRIISTLNNEEDQQWMLAFLNATIEHEQSLSWNRSIEI